MTDNVPILLAYSFNRKRLLYHTKERVNAKDWDAENMRVKASAKHYETIRGNLDILEAKILDLNQEAMRNKISPTVKNFREELHKLEARSGLTLDESLSIQSIAAKYLAKLKEEQATNTYKVVNTSLNHLLDFVKRQSANVAFDDIDQDFIERFKKYMNLMRDEHGEIIKNSDGSQQYRMHNTIIKNLDGIRNFLNWCKRKEYFKNTIEWGDLDLKVTDTEVIYLSLDEVKHLIGLKLDKPHLAAIRDIFVFGCFTGQRHEDIAKLRKVDIKEDDIKFHITKGGKTTLNSVSLVPITREILSRYRDLPGELALPVRSNQKMNEYLKVIMKEAGFNDNISIAHKRGDGKIIKTDYEKWELITFHVSRKSFITNAIAKGMDEIVIKSLTGHSKNSKAFSRYYEVVHDRKQSEMLKAFTF